MIIIIIIIMLLPFFSLLTVSGGEIIPKEIAIQAKR